MKTSGLPCAKALRGDRKSGFEPIPKKELWGGECKHPEHNPPMHICIPPGRQYRHVCPACGHEVVLRPPQSTLGSTECARTGGACIASSYAG